MGSLQDIDQIALIKPHVKWHCHISSVKGREDGVITSFFAMH
jgi:hypothetical protein